MDIIQITVVGIIGTILIMTIKKESPGIAVLMSIAVGVIIFLAVTAKVSAVADMLFEITEKMDLDIKYVGLILKIIGIAYISQFGAQICADAGQGSIASKIELAGKIMIMTISAPVLLSLIDLITDLI